jgi:hypothetical protein
METDITYYVHTDYHVDSGRRKRGVIEFDKRCPVMKSFLDYISPPIAERQASGVPAFMDDERQLVRYTFDVDE